MVCRVPDIAFTDETWANLVTATPFVTSSATSSFHADLFAYTSMLHRLAIEKQGGVLRISPRELNCAAEPLLAETRTDIEDAFRCPLLNLCPDPWTSRYSLPCCFHDC